MRVIFMKSLEELRRDISHMDEVELLAFGRKVRSQPDSEEYKEARADWKRRQEKKVERESQRKGRRQPLSYAVLQQRLGDSADGDGKRQADGRPDAG